MQTSEEGTQESRRELAAWRVEEASSMHRFDKVPGHSSRNEPHPPCCNHPAHEVPFRNVQTFRLGRYFGPEACLGSVIGKLN